MHPILFSIFHFPIHAYGFMLALSFLIGIWLSTKRAQARGLNTDTVADLGFYVILAAIIGARLYYVGLHFDEFKGNLTNIFNPFQNGYTGIGGLVMYGGFLGAIFAGIIYFRIKKVAFLPYADLLAPGVGIGIFLTRIGCFMNGCCYGAPTKSAWGIVFPPESPAGAYAHHVSEGMVSAGQHLHSVALNPSQLIEALGGLIIALFVLMLGNKKVIAGREFFSTVLLYAVLRFFVDFTRVYTPSERFAGLSHNQILCIALFIVFGGLLLKILMQNSVSGAQNQPRGTTHEPPSAPAPKAE